MTISKLKQNTSHIKITPVGNSISTDPTTAAFTHVVVECLIAGLGKHDFDKHVIIRSWAQSITIEVSNHLLGRVVDILDRLNFLQKGAL